MFWAEIWKILEFLSENFHCFGGKIFSIFEQACFRNVKQTEEGAIIQSEAWSTIVQFKMGSKIISSLRKQAYSNTLKLSPPKTESFQIKILVFFHISAQNIDWEYSSEPPRRSSSNNYPQSMFLSRNKKKNVYPCKTQFYYIWVYYI